MEGTFREMRRHRQALSRQECVQLLGAEKRGVLAVAGLDGYPYAVPLNFYYDPAEDRIYFHCARQGHKLDAIRACDRVCFTVYEQGWREEGDWSYHPASVVAFGRAAPVTDRETLLAKLRALGEKYYPTPEDVEGELQKDGDRVCLMCIQVDHMTGKRVHER